MLEVSKVTFYLYRRLRTVGELKKNKTVKENPEETVTLIEIFGFSRLKSSDRVFKEKGLREVRIPSFFQFLIINLLLLASKEVPVIYSKLQKS